MKLSGKTNADRLKEITNKLEQGLQDVFNSDKYKEYLTVMSKFHKYSIRNISLILMQNPNATFVAGFNSWKKNFNRNVRKGEHGIKIVAPATYKKKIEEINFDKNGLPITTEKEIDVPFFTTATVFDISQTDGQELPAPGVSQLMGDVGNYKKIFEALKKISPVPIGFENIRTGANGYFLHTEQRIAIQKNMSEIQTIKTAIHEIAHASLHNFNQEDNPQKIDRLTKEVQAESVAYTVCQHFGIDTSDYSFAYIAGWSKDKGEELLKTSLEIIRETAADFINAIEQELSELISEQSKPEILQDKQNGPIIENMLTGDTISTPRGTFYVTDMNCQQMKNAGYGLHHQSEDGKYLIMANGKNAYAIAAEKPSIKAQLNTEQQKSNKDRQPQAKVNTQTKIKKQEDITI